MNKRIIYILIGLVILGVGIFLFLTTQKDKIQDGIIEQSVNDFAECQNAGYPTLESYPEQCKTPDGRTFTNDIGNELEKNDLIRVTSPRPNQSVANSFEVTGEARGDWYFEASFPAKVVDANGKVVGQGPITAQGEWMTTEFVPFKGTIAITSPTTASGKLILEKSNASGLPENADSLEIPISFSGGGNAEQTSVRLYFNNTAQKAECEKVIAVSRNVEKTPTIGKAALEQLLAGPTDSEKKAGVITSIPEGAKLVSLKIENGVATADFNDALNKNVAGSCRVMAIRAQITETLKQFPTVQTVTISVNGKTEGVLEP